MMKREPFDELLKHVGHTLTCINEIFCLDCKRTISSKTCGCHNHNGHPVVCVCYGEKDKPAANVAIECELCKEVIFDIDRDFEEEIST